MKAYQLNAVKLMFYIDIGNEMTIYDLIEECYLEQHHLDDKIINQVIAGYSTNKWITVTKQFLSGLNPQHHMSGDDIYKLTGIIEFYKDNDYITDKQKWYLAWTLIRNWHQLDIKFYNYYMT